ncbi:hypothetical protein ACG02S_01540 [Roseateles sp. DC23W]|uniref:Uncharacterized protein n=1 Tax=Pelomonas dachongensis TaxID=3299029 RepID=A0ABW7EGJ9_9BURK
MRFTLLLIACAAALSACSKPDTPSEDQPPAEPATADTGTDVHTAAFIKAVKQDFATQLVASASEACGSVKGSDMPDLKSGSPMTYSAAGVIDWGKGQLDYVHEPGAKIGLVNTRGEGTFSFVVDVHVLASGQRQYVAGLSQLQNGSLSASITDERDAMAHEGDTSRTRGNLCVGGTTPPARVTQGMWPLAAKHLQAPGTSMLCIDPASKSGPVTLAFSFDGKTLQAGDHRFTAADAAHSETLMIDPVGNTPGVIYSVNRADGAGAGIGLPAPGVLHYAQLDLPGRGRMMCGRP